MARAPGDLLRSWQPRPLPGWRSHNTGPGITGIGPVRMRAFRSLAGQGNPGHVALTFDDGPDPSSTPEFVQVLADRKVRATFFMLGSMVARSPRLAAEIATPDQVAVDRRDHRYLPARSPRATRSDLTRAAELIADVTGTSPRLFRPPYGVLSGPALLTARELGLTPVLWGAWGREWAPRATSQSVLRTLLRGLDGGVTVLLHDSGCTSPPGAWQAGLGASRDRSTNVNGADWQWARSASTASADWRPPTVGRRADRPEPA